MDEQGDFSGHGRPERTEVPSLSPWGFPTPRGETRIMDRTLGAQAAWGWDGEGCI